MTLTFSGTSLYWTQVGKGKEDCMKIKWYGHASFLITSDEGLKIITDPYESGAYGGQLAYGKIQDQADIVLTSHDHADHNDIKSLPGSPEVVKKAGSVTVKGISVKGVSTYHDPSKGSERGTNIVFKLLINGINICHLGDLGHGLTEKEVLEIGPVDILFIPVGGFYTIDAKQATRVVEQIKPKVVVPMHFKTAKCGFPIAPVDEFLKGKSNVKHPKTQEVEFSQANLPKQLEIVVFEHTL
jgi:L-ascorbate metabolism protein UlaG (beta-lactamase superfamily)